GVPDLLGGYGEADRSGDGRRHVLWDLRIVLAGIGPAPGRGVHEVQLYGCGSPVATRTLMGNQPVAHSGGPPCSSPRSSRARCGASAPTTSTAGSCASGSCSSAGPSTT